MFRVASKLLAKLNTSHFIFILFSNMFYEMIFHTLNASITFIDSKIINNFKLSFNYHIPAMLLYVQICILWIFIYGNECFEINKKKLFVLVYFCSYFYLILNKNNVSKYFIIQIKCTCILSTLFISYVFLKH